MNARIAAILVLLLVLLGGGAVLVYQRQHAMQPANIGTLGQPLLKGLVAAKIAAIRIAQPKSILTLEHKGSGWVIDERGGFPADFDKVRAFVLEAIELKIGQSEPIGTQDRARLHLLEPDKGHGAGTLVEFRGADGKPLARLLIGKKYFKHAPNDPATAAADGRFVLRPADPGTVYVVSDPLTQATARSAAWIDKSGISAEKLKTLEVHLADGEHWKIERANADADWKLVGARAGEKVESTKANAASYSLSLLELADVAPPGTSAHSAGFDKPDGDDRRHHPERAHLPVHRRQAGRRGLLPQVHAPGRAPREAEGRGASRAREGARALYAAGGQVQARRHPDQARRPAREEEVAARRDGPRLS